MKMHFWARLSGDANPYKFAEVEKPAGGFIEWTETTGGVQGIAHDVNEAAGLAGIVVRIHRVTLSDYHFDSAHRG